MRTMFLILILLPLSAFGQSNVVPIVITDTGPTPLVAVLPVEHVAAAVPRASAINFTVVMPAGISYQSITPGQAVTDAGKQAQANVDPADATRLNVVILGLNQNTIATGQLAQLTFQGQPGSYLLNVENVTVSNAAGTQISEIATQNGSFDLP